MIVSIVFRHATENEKLRNLINEQCFIFKKYTQDITRVQVVISRVSHQNKSSSSIQCHISIHAAGRKYFDIYEKHSSDGIAFNRAFDRACSELSQQYSGRYFNRHVIENFLKKSESYLYGTQLTT